VRVIPYPFLGFITEKETVANPYPYKVDGEIGRFMFTTHSIFHKSQRQYNTARDLFVSLRGVEIYKTIGFKDIALIYGDTEQSYQNWDYPGLVSFGKEM
jgi:hypothetical protein